MQSSNSEKDRQRETLNRQHEKPSYSSIYQWRKQAQRIPKNSCITSEYHFFMAIQFPVRSPMPFLITVQQRKGTTGAAEFIYLPSGPWFIISCAVFLDWFGAWVFVRWNEYFEWLVDFVPWRMTWITLRLLRLLLLLLSMCCNEYEIGIKFQLFG